MAWPESKDFAFTIFDDTDFATLENVRPVYDLLTDFGFRTTKTAWPVYREGQTRWGGTTCEDKDYLIWLKSLQSSGFEIAYHMATSRSSLREDTIIAIQKFAQLFDHYPKSMANHIGCAENIYWGDARLSGLQKVAYNALTMNRNKGKWRGHIEGDPYFWGDVCREKIKYVRNFVFRDVNTLKSCPMMPYQDQERSYVNYWFAASDGAGIRNFKNCLTESSMDRLEEEGGACIMYTHFGSGFYRDGELDAKFRSLMRRLSTKNGWFVPVSRLLDYLLEARGHYEITARERSKLERKWLWEKVRHGTS